MNFSDLMNSLIKTTLDERGRIYLPKSLRKILNLNENDELFISVDDNFFCVYTAQGLEKKIRNLVS